MSTTVLDSNHLLVAYWGQVDLEYGTVIVGTISDDSISFGSFDTPVIFNEAWTTSISVTTLDNNHFVIGYKDLGNSSYGTAIVGNIK